MNDSKNSISAQILFLEEEHLSLKKKCKELENIIQIDNDKISKLKTLLRIEKFKSYFFSEIIKRNTSINIEDIYQETDNDIQINNFPDGNIPVIVNDYFGDCKQYCITKGKINQKQHGQHFRSVKNQVSEKPEEVEEKIKQVDEQLEEIVQENNMDVSIKETINNIENIFSELDKIRVYKRHLSNLKEIRSKLLGKIDIDEYTKLLKTHVSRLETIFIKKKYEEKKISSTITLSLSSVEQRLLFYGRYYDTDLDTDDIQKFKICLKVNKNCFKRYIPFNMSDLSVKIPNYMLSIFTIKDIIKHLFINPYGFPNLVYLETDKSTIDDPYTFYSLEKIDDEGKRYWKMECRLDNISKIISEQIRNACIIMFRKIYFDIYNDNIFRIDYNDKYPATRQDCEQLLINIIGLTKQKSFCNTLRNVIVKYSTIKPCKLDKFNFTRDDPIVKKSFHLENDNQKDCIDVISRLFDNICTEDIESICNEKSL